MRFGFSSHVAALLVGLIVMVAGTVSSATISIGSAGYLADFLDPFAQIDRAWLTIFIIAAVAAIACIGILESVAFAGLMTLIEIGGLLAIIAGGFFGSTKLITWLPEVIPSGFDAAV